MRTKKFIYYIYQYYKYLFFIPLFALSTMLFSAMAVILSILINPNLGYWRGVFWARFNSYITPMQVTIKGRHHIKKNRSYVFVANHQSYYDILVLVGFMPLNLK